MLESMVPAIYTSRDCVAERTLSQIERDKQRLLEAADFVSRLMKRLMDCFKNKIVGQLELSWLTMIEGYEETRQVDYETCRNLKRMIDSYYDGERWDLELEWQKT